ncbi:MAG: hypothetical protein QW434_05285 [Pyrobaculum sp.]
MLKINLNVKPHIRAIVIAVILLLLFTPPLYANAYVDVYVEGPPLIDDLNIYAYDGGRWLPVHITYVPEIVPTLVIALNKTENMPYYNASRYILHLPVRAIAAGGKPPADPAGFEKWEVEIFNKSRRVVVPIYVGKGAMGKDVQTTWYRLGVDQRAAYRGVIKRGGAQLARNQQTLDATSPGQHLQVSTPQLGSSFYVVGNIYFKSVTSPVSGWVSLTFPVHNATNDLYTACPGIDAVAWIGAEVTNVTIGVKIEGYLAYSTLYIDVYEITLSGCTYIETLTLNLPYTSGIFWTNTQFKIYNPNDAAQRSKYLGFRARIYGYATLGTKISVSPVVRYQKTLYDYSQIATTTATFRGKSTSNISYDYDYTWSATVTGKNTWAILFGPFIAFDGAIGETIGKLSMPLINIAVSNAAYPCPVLSVSYYLNGFNIYSTLVFPTSPTPYYGRCSYPSLQPMQIDITRWIYATSKARSIGGGFYVSVMFTVQQANAVYTISGKAINITYSRWTEPYRSVYLSPQNLPYSEWFAYRTLDTVQMISMMPNATTGINFVSRVVAGPYIYISLQSNYGMCHASIEFQSPAYFSLYGVFYSDVQKKDMPYWVDITLRTFDAIAFLLSFGTSTAAGYAALGITMVTSLIRSAYSTLDYSGGVIRWIKGWSEAAPKDVYIVVSMITPSTTPVTWRPATVEVYYNNVCTILPVPSSKITMYISRNDQVPTISQGALYKMWTWRGLTYSATGPILK